MVALLIGAVVAIACLAVVALPFFRRTHRGLAQDASVDLRSWAVQELKALETERLLEEVTEGEFAVRRNELRVRAARALRDAAESAEAGLLDDDFLEAEIRAFRRAHSRILRCPQCREPLPGPVAECPRCGAAIAATPQSSGPAPNA
ncbi:MAG: hypothetical protein FJ315_04285 [SAR202 cluster bacterium]|nr:hypothetical protein [SAR202 cluster bacterium]